jgi:glycosyltransferase involved in cell wall biosynthesis
LSIKGVSVIICCFNSEPLLEQTLNHIAAQNFDTDLNCEVILVDNASSDNTREKAIAVWDKNHHNKIKLVIVYEGRPGLAYARQKGINEAQYEYLVYCDDDNWLDKNYINNVVSLFDKHPEVAILGGTGIAALENASEKPEWFDRFYQSYAIGPQGNGETIVNGVYGAGMAIRNSVLTRVMNMQPMFLHGRKQDELTSGEDTEICYRVRLAGYRILYSPQLVFTHFLTVKRLTWAYLLKLHAGLAKSFVVLNLYEKATGSEKTTLPIFYWLKKALYYGIIYLKYWPQQYAAYKKGEGTIEEIYHVTWKNIAANYFEYNFKTVLIYRKITIFRKNDN